MRPKILRIFKIWEQRSVYDEEFLSDLTGLLSAGAVKKDDDSEFQVSSSCNTSRPLLFMDFTTCKTSRLLYKHPISSLCLPLCPPSSFDITYSALTAISCIIYHDSANIRASIPYYFSPQFVWHAADMFCPDLLSWATF